MIPNQRGMGSKACHVEKGTQTRIKKGKALETLQKAVDKAQKRGFSHTERAQ
jgi:hypothetical protein